MNLTWEQLHPESRQVLETQLMTWVDWLARAYPAIGGVMRPCWRAHPEAARELIAYMVWWEAVYEPLRDEDRDNGASAVDWHEAMPELRARFVAAFESCTDEKCARGSFLSGLGTQTIDDRRQLEGVPGMEGDWKAPIASAKLVDPAAADEAPP